MTTPTTTRAAGRAPGEPSGVRPQSLMLVLLGQHVLGREIAVFSGSFIDIFARLGISEEAVRSTLGRMVTRGLLERHRRGRRMYFGLTARSAAVLADGHHRVWHVGAVNDDWDGTWTVVGFSLPESWHRERHDLRSRLLWGGFGPLQNGVWVAPARVDIPALVGDLGLDDHLRVFVSQAAEPSDASGIIRGAFDLDAIAGRYRGFLQRWDLPHPHADLPDDLARQLLLHTHWLDLIRSNPRLPVQHLPADWPAVRAERIFHTLAESYAVEATRIIDEVLDTVPVG